MKLTWFHISNLPTSLYVLCEGAKGYNNERAVACCDLVDVAPEGDWRVTIGDQVFEICAMDDQADLLDGLVPTSPEHTAANLKEAITRAIVQWIDKDFVLA